MFYASHPVQVSHAWKKTSLQSQILPEQNLLGQFNNNNNNNNRKVNRELWSFFLFYFFIFFLTQDKKSILV